MQLYSTNNKSHIVNLKEAVMNSLPLDNGLYMPVELTKLPQSFYENLNNYSFKELSFEIAKHLLGDYIPHENLRNIIFEAINFPAPLKSLDKNLHILELFHGPSLAFKDFGARFMARLMSYFNRESKKELTILVATSGDTGGAVAAGFYDTPGIKVIILYPSGKVSPLQEKQLTTLGKNISAIEIEGTFDDCQKLVKQAFLNKELNKHLNLSSANSINIARLIPQSFYYFEAIKQLGNTDKLSFVIPSGNFGNLTAGLIAKKLGLPFSKLIAATNANNVVPIYLETGAFKPVPSVATISNAMDVGNPSNFSRIMDIYGSTWNNVKEDVKGFSFNDEETKAMMKKTFDEYNYILDPHTAVGVLALRKYQKDHPEEQGIVLETAHPSKFISEVEPVIGAKVEIPESLASIASKKKEAVLMKNSFDSFYAYLMK